MVASGGDRAWGVPVAGTVAPGGDHAWVVLAAGTVAPGGDRAWGSWHSFLLGSESGWGPLDAQGVSESVLCRPGSCRTVTTTPPSSCTCS